MTPSGWHDDARNRDAGHDEMQIEIFEWVSACEKMGTLDVFRGKNFDRREYSRTDVQFEAPFSHDGTVICFADICESFHAEEPWVGGNGVNHRFYYRILEVKPKIYSVGAIIRQCAATEESVKRWWGRVKPISQNKLDGVWVVPAVRATDEKLPLLLRVCERVAVWDGERLQYRKGARL